MFWFCPFTFLWPVISYVQTAVTFFDFCLLYSFPCVSLTKDLVADSFYLVQPRKAASVSQFLPKANYIFFFLWPAGMNHFPQPGV